MGLLGGINVKFSADLSNLSKGFSQATRLIGSFGGGVSGPMGIAATAVAGIGIAAIGMAASSVSAAADFQQSMLKVQAYAGLSKKQADDMSQSILQMSTAVGVGPKQLADALYPIISSGYSASDALNILKLSAMTAAASGADTSKVADGLTTSLKAMHAPASDAAKYMDIMNATVSVGKTEFPAYSAIIGKISLSAVSAKIPFLDMNAALATLTTHGFPSVAQASTALSNMFNQMGPKVDAMAQHAKKLGIAFDENAFKGMSLSEKIAYLNKVTGGNQGEVLKLLGGSTLALKAFTALSGSTQDYADNLKKLQNSQGATAGVFATASQGYNFHMQQLSAAFDTLKVTIGNALLPVLTQLLAGVTPLITQFSSWVSGLESGKSSVNGFSGVIKWLGDFAQNVLLPIWNQLQNTFKTQVIPAFQAMWQNIQPLLPGLGNLAMVVGVILGTAIQIFIRIWGSMMQMLSGAITIVAGILAFLGDLFTGHFEKLGTDLKGIWQGITQFFTGWVSGIIAPFQQMYDTITGNAQKMRIQTAIQHNQAKIDAVNNATEEAKKVLEQEEAKRLGIIQKLEQTKDPKQRAELEMQLSAINAKEAETKKVLDSEEQKKQQLLKKQQDLKAQMDENNKNIAQKTIDWFGQLKDGALQKITDFNTSVNNKITQIAQNIVKIVLDLKKQWDDRWNDIVNSAVGILDLFKKGVAIAFNMVIDQIDGLINNINSVSSKVGIPAIPDIPHLANGTSFFPGGLALVGEKGPEYVNLPTGSQVYPNGTTPPGVSGSSSAPGSGSGAGQPIHVHVEFDTTEIAHMVGNTQTGIMRVKAGRRFV